MFFISGCSFLTFLHFAFFIRCDAWSNRDGLFTFVYGSYIPHDPEEIGSSDSSAPLSQPDYKSSTANESVRNRLLFHFYSKKHPAGYEIQFHSESRITSIFDALLPTVFITHGWKRSLGNDACRFIRRSYLTGPVDVNVIVVDWTYFARMWYMTAISKINDVANEITYVIRQLESLHLIQPSMTTLVGHSLGAHVMGVVGRNMKGAIGIIFGLDPARPSISTKHKELRISKECARHVQIIHTNGLLLGIYEALGHSDFYPNGGKTQYGCSIKDRYKLGRCSHNRAWEYFAESLNSPIGFKARRCESGKHSRKKCTGSIAFMGGYLNNMNLHGEYYLETHDVYPYAKM